MESAVRAVARSLVGLGVKRVIRILGIALHLLLIFKTKAHIGVRHYTKAHTQMLAGTEACYEILEVGNVSILRGVTLLKHGALERHADVEDERQRIDTGIRRWVEIVNLIALAESNAYAVHATTGTVRLVYQ